MLADWRARWSGRKLFRTAAGPDWIRLHLAGDERPAILLTCLPGAAVALSHLGRLPEPVHTALAATRQHPLGPLLAGAELVGCGLLPADRVVCLDWADPRGRRLTLLHQLFGSRGNTALVDPRGKLLWAWRRPPHLLLTVPPAAAVWEQDVTGPPADRVSAPALDHLAGALARRSHQEAVSWLSRHLRSTDKLVANLTRDLDQRRTGRRVPPQGRSPGRPPARTDRRAPQPAWCCPIRGTVRRWSSTWIPPSDAGGNLEAWFRKARKAEQGPGRHRRSPGNRPRGTGGPDRRARCPARRRRNLPHSLRWIVLTRSRPGSRNTADTVKKRVPAAAAAPPGPRNPAGRSGAT